MDALWAWVSKMLSETDGTPSSKRVVMVYGAGVASGIVAALTVFVMAKCTAEQVSNMFPTVFIAFLTSTVLGYVGGKAAERGQSN
jgi:hypothetical protein